MTTPETQITALLQKYHMPLFIVLTLHPLCFKGVPGLAMPTYPLVSKHVLQHMMLRTKDHVTTGNGHTSNLFGTSAYINITCLVCTSHAPNAPWLDEQIYVGPKSAALISAIENMIFEVYVKKRLINARDVAGIVADDWAARIKGL
jgi:hypothetical protein